MAAELVGWSSVGSGQDTLWWKPTNGKAIALHQDDSFMASLDPPTTITCWATLDDVSADGGTIEYVPGSHRWPLTEKVTDFHASHDYRSAMLACAAAIGHTTPESVPLEVTAGSCVFHDGRIWHGSAPNANADTQRRSIGVHMLRGDVRYSRSTDLATSTAATSDLTQTGSRARTTFRLLGARSRPPRLGERFHHCAVSINLTS